MLLVIRSKLIDARKVLIFSKFRSEAYEGSRWSRRLGSLPSKIKIWVCFIRRVIIQRPILIIQFNPWRLLPLFSIVRSKRSNRRLLIFFISISFHFNSISTLRFDVAINLEYILIRKETRYFAVFDNIILFFELVVLFPCF